MTQQPDCTIEPMEDRFAVYEHSIYDSSSEAEVVGHSTRQELVLPDTPPAWFDPTIAGEEW